MKEINNGKNKYAIEKEYLCVRDLNDRFLFFTDKSCLEKLIPYRWCLKDSGNFDCDALIDGKRFKANRFLANVNDPKLVVDHKDGDRRNNCQQNLRIATQSQNAANRRASTRNTSGCKGVSYNTELNMWHGDITINMQRKFLGRFREKKDAVAARKAAEKELLDEFGYSSRFDE